MRYAELRCPNPSCGFYYPAIVEDGYHAECPNCHQVNRVPGKDLSKEITGMCDLCENPLDHHIYGRDNFCCPPRKGYAR